MISTLEKEITLRFLKARKKDGFLNVISIFSFIGISLGVAVQNLKVISFSKVEINWILFVLL